VRSWPEAGVADGGAGGGGEEDVLGRPAALVAAAAGDWGGMIAAGGAGGLTAPDAAGVCAAAVAVVSAPAPVLARLGDSLTAAVAAGVQPPLLFLAASRAWPASSAPAVVASAAAVVRLVADATLAAGGSVDAVDDATGCTALHAAAAAGDDACVAELLAAGASPLATTAGGLSALHFAVAARAPRVLHRLVAAVNTPPAILPAGWLPLPQFAAAQGSADCLAVLHALGAPASVADAGEWTAAGVAAFFGVLPPGGTAMEGIDTGGATWLAGDNSGAGAAATPRTASAAATSSRAGTRPAVGMMAPTAVEVHVRLGMEGTVPSTREQPPLLLPAETVAAAGGAATVLVQAVTRGEGGREEVAYTARVPLVRERLGWTTPPGVGGSLVYYRAPVGGAAPAPYPAMVFPTARLEDLAFMLRLLPVPSHAVPYAATLARARGLDTYGEVGSTPDCVAAVDATPPLATLLVSALYLTGSMTGAAGAGAAAASALAPLAGQLMLPLALASPVPFAAAVASLRYQTIQGYAPLTPIPPAPTPNGMLPPAHSPTYWAASHIFGHRGSGADNAAVVPATSSSTPGMSLMGGGGAAAAAAAAAAATTTEVTGTVRHTHIQENTIWSLAAGGAAGAEYVEFDVMLSRDGVPVIHHDWGLRLPGASRIRMPVTHLSAAQFTRLPAQVMTNDVVTRESTVAAEADDGLASRAEALARSRTLSSAGTASAGTALAGGVDSAAAGANTRRLAALGLDAVVAPADKAGAAAAAGVARDYSLGMRDGLGTLYDVLTRVPTDTGANVEVKYPTAAEAAAYGLRQPERNFFADRILDVVYAAAGDRRIMFSTFDPDMAVVLARKQLRYPVFLLTEAGTPPAPLPDARMNSLASAVAFATAPAVGLFGIVTDVTPLLTAPRMVAAVQHDARLALATYGRANNDPAVVALQVAAAVGAVIVDHVSAVVASLRHPAAATTSTSDSVVVAAAAAVDAGADAAPAVSTAAS